MPKDQWNLNTARVWRNCVPGFWASLPLLSTSTSVFHPSGSPQTRRREPAWQSGQGCVIQDECESEDAKCPSGKTKVGWERGKCGKNKAHSSAALLVPLPTAAAGEAREVIVIDSAILVSPLSSPPTEEAPTRRAIRISGSRDKMVFCCETGGWDSLIDSCYWSNGEYQKASRLGYWSC